MADKVVKKSYTLAHPVITPTDASIQSVKWESSDETIATVDESGLVTGVAPGTCTIFVKSYDDKTIVDSCEITVIK